MTRRFSCPACRLSILDYCVHQRIPKPLCGLCELMGPEHLARYLAKWNPTVGALADEPDEEEEAA
jgi:hypothetical protein